MACRPRRTRKPCRRSTGAHHASRKPNRCPDSGRISFENSYQDKLGVVEKGQFDLLAQGCYVGVFEQHFAGPLPLGAQLPSFRQGQYVVARRLASRVRLAQPILNREVRRAVVPRFKGWIRRGVSRLVSPAAEAKSQSRSAIHGRPVVTPILWRPVVAPVHGRVHRHAPSPIVIPAASAAILGLGDRRDNGQCGGPRPSAAATQLFAVS
jgi:hypothetical protein